MSTTNDGGSDGVVKARIEHKFYPSLNQTTVYISLEVVGDVGTDQIHDAFLDFKNAMLAAREAKP